MAKILTCKKSKKNYPNYKTDKQGEGFLAFWWTDKRRNDAQKKEPNKHSREVFVSYMATFYNFVWLRQKSVFWGILFNVY